MRVILSERDIEFAEMEKRIRELEAQLAGIAEELGNPHGDLRADIAQFMGRLYEADLRVEELEEENAALRAVLKPLYSRFEDDEEGCAECHCCPICCINDITQSKYGVSHYDGCQLAEVMQRK